MTLEDELNQHLHQVGEATKKYNYNPTCFIRILEEYEGVETVKQLMKKAEAQQGLLTFWGLSLLMNLLIQQVINRDSITLLERREIKNRMVMQ